LLNKFYIYLQQTNIVYLSFYLIEQSPDIILVIIPDGSFPGG
jgi:hypothetical protein